MFSQRTFRKYFDTKLPFAQFSWNLTLLSVVSILPFLVVYVASTPEFAGMLLTNTTALSRFVRQVLTNGLPVVFLVNYIGFVSVSVFLDRKDGSTINYLILDGVMRAVVFVGLHALIYVFSVDLFGSFGGDRGVALRVVGPTLQRSYLFENISGVYLYALLPGAIVVYGTVLRRTKTGGFENKIYSNRMWTRIAVSAIFVLPVFVVTLFSTVLAHLLGQP